MLPSGERERILEVLFPEKRSAFWKYCSRKNAAHFGSTKPGKTPASAHAGPISPFLFFRVQYFQNAFWKYCSRKKRFGSTVPGKNVLEVLFPEKTRVQKVPRVQKSPRLASLKVKRILEVLFPEKCALSAGERSRWPNITFFIFPGTVLPFFYFSVVRKVPEKPVLFLPHPLLCPSKPVESRKRRDNRKSHNLCLHVNWCLVIQAIGYLPVWQNPYLSTTI